MKLNRRNFLHATAGVGALSLIPAAVGREPQVSDEILERAAARPVLPVKEFKQPIIIESVELLRKGKQHFVRVRSKDGAEGISVDDGRMDILHPIFNELIAPYFIGKDARDLEEHLFEAYRYKSNYKLIGLALWCPIALVEFAILDLMGRMRRQSLGELLGGVVRTTIPFYVASERRDTTPEQEVDYLKSLIDQTGAKAVKYRLGGRMSRNQDAMPGRTKKVADALSIPIALGEQESSEWRFQWVIRNRVADIVQPDLYYYGGMIRSI